MYQKILWKIQSLWEQYYQPHCETVFSIENYPPQFNLVDVFSFEESKQAVFSDEYGEYLGLKNFQVMKKDDKYWYLFDNHNEIIYPFVELCEATKKPLTIVHIDAHRDDAEFEGEKVKEISLSSASEYINKTRISDFFDALSETQIIEEIIRITDSDSFLSYTNPNKPYIISLDIDIFGDEGAFIDLETKVKVIAEACSEAQAVCIATSPGFINQEFAHEIIKIISKT